MKKLLSLLLIAAMLLPSFVLSASALPGDNALKFGGKNVYVYFYSLKLNASDAAISFDLSMEADSEGAPLLSMNSGAVEISTTYVKIGQSRTAFTWGTAETNHFRHVDIVYSGGTCTVSVDGKSVASASASLRTEGLYFIGYPGNQYIDNLKIVSGGNTLVDTDFEDSSYYNSLINGDTSCVLEAIPSDSYYDYDQTPVPENVQYLFNSDENCAKLVVSSGEKILAGDIDGNKRLTSSDTLSEKKIIAGKLTRPENGSGDVNGDGRYNSNDVRTLKSMVVGKTAKRYIEIASGASAVYDSAMQSARLTSSASTTNGVNANLTMSKIDADNYKYAVITYMTPNKEGNKNSTAAAESGFGAYGNFVTFTLNTDGKFHSQIVDLSEMSTWNGDSATLRFFVAANAGDTMYVDSIIFCASTNKAHSAVAARESAKENYKINDEEDPVVGGPIGSYDSIGNYVIRFDTKAKVDGYVSVVNNSKVGFSDDAMRITATAGADPGVYLDLTAEGLNAGDFDYIAYVIRVPTSNQKNAPNSNIYYVCGNINEPTGGYESSLVSLKKNDVYHTAIFDLSGKANFTGALKGMRIDYFTDCGTGDYCYIDSILFGKTEGNVFKAGNNRVKERNPITVSSASDIFNMYRTYCQNANGNEYIQAQNGDYAMYFKFNSDVSKFTARSLGDRMARAISQATGIDVTCDVYMGYVDIKDSYSTSQPCGYVYYTLHYDGEYYIVRLMTYILKNSSYTDELDGTSADPDVTKPNLSTWYEDGYSVGNLTTLCATGTLTCAAHSCNECRIVDTPYGSFAAVITNADESTWSKLHTADFSVFRIYDDGSSKKLGTYDMSYHTSKPSIFYAGDGNVYFIQCDDQSAEDYCHITIGYFDPSKPKADGTYDITVTVDDRAFPGGAAPSGYGYNQAMLDDVNHRFIMMCNGGNHSGYFTWFIWDYNKKAYENNNVYTIVDTYRHCYLYGYPDGKNGMYVVGGRDMELKELGLDKVVQGIEYAFDEVNLFYFPDMHKSDYIRMCVSPADYTQIDRGLFPDTINNCNGDTYLDTEGYLHVLSSTTYRAANHDVIVYDQMYYKVFDCRGIGATPKEIYSAPIKFGKDHQRYQVRMTESTSGEVYILAMNLMDHESTGRIEIWRKLHDKFEYELVGCKNFSGNEPPRNSHMIGCRRNGSVIDDTVSVMYPAGWGGPYKLFTVTLK